MKKKKYVDIISGILLIALGSIYFYSATTLPEALTTEPLGPAGFPQFLAVVLIDHQERLLQLLLLSRQQQIRPDQRTDQDQRPLTNERKKAARARRAAFWIPGDYFTSKR